MRTLKLSQISEFEQVFMGELGFLPGVQYLNTNPNIKPFIMPRRRMSIAIRRKLREELTRLESLGMVEAVDEPTPWVSEVIVALKKKM